MQQVKLCCPLCPWESPVADVTEPINGVWLAFSSVGPLWHTHFDTVHRVAPVRVILESEG